MSRHEDDAWNCAADGPDASDVDGDEPEENSADPLSFCDVDEDSDQADLRASAKCSKCFDTGTVYESHGEAVNCEAPGCDAVPQFEEVDALPRDTIETPPIVCKRCEDIAKNNAVGPWNPHTCGGEDPEQS